MTKNKIKMVFIILHYKNLKDTLECIKSIKKLEDKSFKIVVVDNHSGNDEDDKRLEKQVDDLLILEENLGFANGNNYGVDYARKKYKPEFMAVINNDTIVEQPDLIKRVETIYNKKNFDALGFQIITDNGASCNPFPAYKTLEEVKKAIRKSKKLINIYQSKTKRNLLQVYMRVKRVIKKPKKMENAKVALEDIPLHGCAIIFSKKYIERYKDAFYHGTFLYHEEEFLEYRRKKDHLKFIYDPSITIFHKEGASLNYNYTEDEYKKFIFRNENILKSLYLLKDIMENKRKI